MTIPEIIGRAGAAVAAIRADELADEMPVIKAAMSVVETSRRFFAGDVNGRERVLVALAAYDAVIEARRARLGDIQDNDPNLRDGPTLEECTMSTETDDVEVFAICNECDVTWLVEAGKSQTLTHVEDGSHSYDPEAY